MYLKNAVANTPFCNWTAELFLRQPLKQFIGIPDPVPALLSCRGNRLLRG